MGKVIGKEGRIAKAIRTIMKAQAAKDSKKIRGIINAKTYFIKYLPPVFYRLVVGWVSF